MKRLVHRYYCSVYTFCTQSVCLAVKAALCTILCDQLLCAIFDLKAQFFDLFLQYNFSRFFLKRQHLGTSRG